MKLENKNIVLQALKDGKYTADFINGGPLRKNGKPISPIPTPQGYRTISVYPGDSRPGVRVYLHDFIWLAAGRDIPEGARVWFKNGKKFDTRLANLYLAKRRQDYGITKLYKQGYEVTQIREMTGKNRRTIKKIIDGIKEEEQWLS